MSLYTKEELAALREQWKKALMAAATGKSYSIGNRRLDRYDLPEIRKMLDWIEKEQAALDGRRGMAFVKGVYRRSGSWR